MQANLTRYGAGYIVNHPTEIKKDQVWIGRNHEEARVLDVTSHTVQFTINGEGPFTLTHGTFKSCASLYIPDEQQRSAS